MNQLFGNGPKQVSADGKLTKLSSFHQTVDQGMFKEGQLKEQMEHYNQNRLTYQDYMRMQQQQPITDDLNFIQTNPMNNNLGMNDYWKQMSHTNQMNNVENSFDKMKLQEKNTQNTVLNNNINNNMNNNMMNHMYNPMMMNNPYMMNQGRAIHPSLLEFNQFLDKNKITPHLNLDNNQKTKETENKENTENNDQEQMENVYQDIINVMENQEDDRMQNSHFLNFIKKLNTGEIKLNEKSNTIDGNLDELKKEQDHYGNNQEINDKLNSFDDLFKNMNVDDYYKQSAQQSMYLQNNPYLDKDSQENKEIKDKNLDRVELAKQYLKENKTNTARQLLEAEVKEFRDNSEAWVLLGKIHSDLDNDNLAANCLLIGKEVDPFNVDCLFALGVSCTNCFEEFDAMKYLLEYIKLHPVYSKVITKNDPRYDYKLLEKEIEKVNNINVNVNSDNVNMDYDKEYDNTNFNMEEFMKQNNNSNNFNDNNYLESRRKVEDMKLNFFNTIVDLFNQIANNNNIVKNEDFYLAFGIASFIPHQNDLSIKMFRKAVEINPNDYNCWNKLGAILAHSKMHENAIECYKKAISLKKDYLRCWANMGIAYNNLDDYDNAKNSFIEALKIDRNNDDVWAYLRSIYSRVNNDNLVELTYKKDLDSILMYNENFPSRSSEDMFEY